MPDMPPSESLRKQSHMRRWRVAAVTILVLGTLSAGLDYWLVSRSQSGLDDLSQLSNDKTAMHQLGVIYGRSGYLLDDMENALARPGMQASVILGVTVILAAGSWFVSRLPAPEPMDDFFKPSEKKEP